MNDDQKNNSQVNPEQPVPAYQPMPNRYGLFILLAKLLIVVGIIFFSLCNYRLFEINKGWSICQINNKTSFSQVIDFITDIEKIEYYAVPHSCNNDYYKIHISTSTKSYLLDATEEDIRIINTLTAVSSNFKPQSVFVIPFYVEVIVAIIVIFIPIGRKMYIPY